MKIKLISIFESTITLGVFLDGVVGEVDHGILAVVQLIFSA
jgi:hypothetical protein